MKKGSILLLIFILTFTMTGCKQKNKQDEKAPAGLKEITGEVKKAKLNTNGDIIIKEDDITDKVVYINYEYERVIIGLLAVKDSNENVKVVVNTCQSCGGSPYAYFVQVGNKIQCQNCGNTFDIDELDNLDKDGCNPIKVQNKYTKNGEITIDAKQLKELKSKFENWKGPKGSLN